MSNESNIFDRRPHSENVAELRRVFRPVLEVFFKELLQEVYEWPLIGSTNDETIRAAYKKQFTLDAIRLVDERLR